MPSREAWRDMHLVWEFGSNVIGAKGWSRPEWYDLSGNAPRGIRLGEAIKLVADADGDEAAWRWVEEATSGMRCHPDCDFAGMDGFTAEEVEYPDGFIATYIRWRGLSWRLHRSFGRLLCVDDD